MYCEVLLLFSYSFSQLITAARLLYDQTTELNVEIKIKSTLYISHQSRVKQTLTPT